MCDIFQDVHQTMREVIAGVDAPAITSMWVWHELDTIRDEVEHVVVLILDILLHPARWKHVDAASIPDLLDRLLA